MKAITFVSCTFITSLSVTAYSDGVESALDISESCTGSRKDFISEVVVAAPDVEEEPVSIAMVELKPEFPGGKDAIDKWISENIVYPADAYEEGLQGRVVVEFVIEKDGTINNVRVVRSRHPSLDEEAVRLVKAMPNWIPGRMNGQLVRVHYVLPVTFKL